MYSRIPLALASVLLMAVYLGYPPPPFSIRLVEWASRGKFAVLGGQRIFYIDHTTKEFLNDGTVLLLHGFPTSSYDWHKIWLNITSHFQRVIAFDFPGYGLSEKRFEKQLYSIESQADAVLELLEHLNVNGVHVIAHDMGDTVVQELLSRGKRSHSSRSGDLHEEDPFVIKSVCMLNGGIFEDIYKPRIIQKVLATPFLGRLLCPFLNFPIFELSMSGIFGSKNPPSEELLKDLYTLMVYEAGHLIISDLLQYMEQRSQNEKKWKKALQETSVPIHFLYGPADPINPPAFVQHFRATLPKASIDLLDSDVGHFPQLEDPSSVFSYYAAFVDTLKT